jgi:hypothetical protein
MTPICVGAGSVRRSEWHTRPRNAAAEYSTAARDLHAALDAALFLPATGRGTHDSAQGIALGLFMIRPTPRAHVPSSAMH